MLEAVTSGVPTVIGWVGDVVDALVGEAGALGPLLPLVGVGIAVSGVLLSIKIVRGLIWGA